MSTGTGASDYSGYIAGIESRMRAAAVEKRARAARARAVLPAIVKVLADDFGASRVVLFGSLARKDFHEESDVDLLVEGIDPSRWFEADARAADLAGEFDLDLVPAAAAHRSLIEKVAREGEVLLDDR